MAPELALRDQFCATSQRVFEMRVATLLDKRQRQNRSGKLNFFFIKKIEKKTIFEGQFGISKRRRIKSKELIRTFRVKLN